MMCGARLRNAAGLRQLEYWTGKLQPRPVVDWCGRHALNVITTAAFHQFTEGGTNGDDEAGARLASSRYLDRVAAAVKAAKQATDGGPITLLAHSAGGWLARVYLLVRHPGFEHGT